MSTNDAVDVLVGVLVGGGHGSSVAHPEVDGVRAFPESLSGPSELAGVQDQSLEFVSQVRVLEET